MQVQRGFRTKLEDYLNTKAKIAVDLAIYGRSVYDFSCFGVDERNQLSDDRYMVFYNQKQSPNKEIEVTLQQGRALYSVDLVQLPYTVNKLVFTVSIDGDGIMSAIEKHTVNILQDNRSILSCEFLGKDFFLEKAIIALEIYRKGTWRVNFVGQGFRGGLPELLKHYGGEEAR
ncbi:tellurium resistance TerZ family protein [bacterium]|nr:tellurium resistance TerZ family protein [bacterium]